MWILFPLAALLFTPSSSPSLFLLPQRRNHLERDLCNSFKDHESSSFPIYENDLFNGETRSICFDKDSKRFLTWERILLQVFTKEPRSGRTRALTNKCFVSLFKVELTLFNKRQKSFVVKDYSEIANIRCWADSCILKGRWW